MKAYLGIGTNIGDRMQNLQDSLDALNLLPMTTVTDVSNVYETDPVGYDNQDDFLNIVVEVETELNMGAKEYEKAFNSLLPDDIYVKSVEEVDLSFHFSYLSFCIHDIK